MKRKSLAQHASFTTLETPRLAQSFDLLISKSKHHPIKGVFHPLQQAVVVNNRKTPLSYYPTF